MLPVLQQYLFLKKTHFINPVGDIEYMKKRENQPNKKNSITFCKIVIFQCHGQKLKIRKFSIYFTLDQQLFFSENMIEWVTGRSQVCLT